MGSGEITLLVMGAVCFIPSFVGAFKKNAGGIFFFNIVLFGAYFLLPKLLAASVCMILWSVAYVWACVSPPTEKAIPAAHQPGAYDDKGKPSVCPVCKQAAILVEREFGGAICRCCLDKEKGGE